VWLRSVCIRTAHFEDALQFYVTTLGLTLGRMGAHPLTACARAWMIDAEGNEVFELQEAQPTDVPGTHELAFGMPRRTVTLLRSRLDLQGIRYTNAGSSLYFADPDGTTIRIDAL
jgi:catechol 2,3-dioxygenase-like lactoylglutathione lyase family enzyme